MTLRWATAPPASPTTRATGSAQSAVSAAPAPCLRFARGVSTLLLSADLTDVSPDEPAFAVVPRTVRHEPIGRAKVELGADYIEQPLWGPAGTCIFCASSNTAPHRYSQIGLS